MQRKNEPKGLSFFSIIIPTYNRKDFLNIAIHSVLTQRFNNYELIVVDDGSIDGTRDLVASIRDERLIYIYQENKGVAYARNRGLDIARGEWIAFLDSDDRWTEDKLEIVSQYIEKHPNCKIFHTQEVWFRRGELLNQKKRHRKPTGYVYQRALELCCISISTAVIHKSVFDAVGNFDEDFEACEDYEFWLRATHEFEVMLIDKSLTIKDGGRDDQLSFRVWGLDRFRIKALEKILFSGRLNARDYALTYAELKKKVDIYVNGAAKRGKVDEVKYYRNLLIRCARLSYYD